MQMSYDSIDREKWRYSIKLFFVGYSISRVSSRCAIYGDTIFAKQYSIYALCYLHYVI